MGKIFCVGIIGAGIVFERHARAYAELADRVRLAAVAEVDEAKLRQATTKHGVAFGCRDYREVLSRKDVEIVTVCTPPCFHERIVIEALEAGKYVICEKPLAHTLEAADRILEVAERIPGKLSTVYQFRYLPEVRRTVWLRDNERLGPLLTAISIRKKLIIFRFIRKQGVVVVSADPKIPLAAVSKIESALNS